MLSPTPLSRQLVVLNVNDDPHAELKQSSYANFLDVENANSVETVQQMLHERGGRSADVFLVDIDMEKTAIPAGLEWGHPRFRAYGPLLALPFIGRGAAAFVPYSGYWGNSAVTNNGFVRVALSLLLTRIFDRPFSLEDVGTYIRESTTEIGSTILQTSLVQEAGVALTQALEQYRRRLEADENVQFVDVDVTYKRLRDLENQAFLESKGWPLRVPFVDSEGALYLDIRYGASRRDCIQLGSLFADMLSFRAPADQSALTPIYDTLERWKAKSVTARGETLYECVTGILARCQEGVPILSAIKEQSDVVESFNRHQVIRLAMALAWTEAWHVGGLNAQRRTAYVHELLGLGTSGPDEGDARAVTAESRHRGQKRIPPAKEQKRAFPTTQYNRLLGKVLKNRIEVSDEPFRTPLRQNYASVAEAYGLNDYEDVGRLTHQEKQECIRYAVEELEWDPSAAGTEPWRPYPRWLRDIT
jgi:hypothetical protein